MFLLSQRLIDTFEEFLGPTPAAAESQSTASNEDLMNTVARQEAYDEEHPLEEEEDEA